MTWRQQGGGKGCISVGSGSKLGEEDTGKRRRTRDGGAHATSVTAAAAELSFTGSSAAGVSHAKHLQAGSRLLLLLLVAAAVLAGGWGQAAATCCCCNRWRLLTHLDLLVVYAVKLLAHGAAGVDVKLLRGRRGRGQCQQLGVGTAALAMMKPSLC